MKSNRQLVRENPKEYKEGQDACIACDDPDLVENPYEKKSDPWMAWNIGWNSK